eukprot:TRINITY_DN2841_c0_g1_i1.p1 TRINITY_DN2841_c0_g1~~TRINITY_DN2841_c0_g1_i1.p1  ORF type:complete len:238 (-),score=113.04 TRINITY_DN2841_c0_g1_i1:115-801(-)
MDQNNAKMLSQLFEELSNSYSRISQVLKAFGDGETVDLPNIFPQVHEAATAAAGAVAPKGKKQKKLPRYENTWSKEELNKLEEGLKRFGFDVTKVQTHIGSRKAAEVKKYMTMYVKAGIVAGVKLPEDHNEESDDESSEEEKPQVKKAPVKKAAAAAPKVASTKKQVIKPKPAEPSESSEEEDSDDDEKAPGKRAAEESSEESSKPAKKAKKNKKAKSESEEESSDSD